MAAKHKKVAKICKSRRANCDLTTLSGTMYYIIFAYNGSAMLPEKKSIENLSNQRIIEFHIIIWQENSSAKMIGTTILKRTLTVIYVFEKNCEMAASI